jgi:SAM-dependent methyltransferase
VSTADRERWNQRYRTGEHHPEPDPWLVQHGELIRARQPGARALDLACGAGRHTLLLAELGYQVDAWDISEVGLELLRGELSRRVSAGQRLNVTAQQVDLETAQLPVAAYDLVLDMYFLERRLFPQMVRALRPGGLLVVRTLMRRSTAEDRNPAHLLRRGELRATVTGQRCGLGRDRGAQARRVGVDWPMGAGLQ